MVEGTVISLSSALLLSVVEEIQLKILSSLFPKQ